LDSNNCYDVFKDYDLVLDGSDNFQTRNITNVACLKLEKPLVAAAISQWEGQITVYYPSAGFPCFKCIFPMESEQTAIVSCINAGVVGSLVGTVGSMMATEAIKIITHSGKPLLGEMLIYDSLWGEVRKIKIARRSDCEVCS